MTDSFLHPDGHHYRFLGFGPDAKKGEGPFYLQSNVHGTLIRIFDEKAGPHAAIFERVEPPLWPWAGPSGHKYELEAALYPYIPDGRSCQYIPPEDFAGLAERLAKQAKLNAEANDD